MSGIIVTTNFTVNTNLPLDDRFTVADNTARNAIVSGRRFQGLLVYVTGTSTMYQLQGGILDANWVALPSSTAGTAPTLFGTYSAGRSVDPLVGVTVAASHMSNSAVNQRVFLKSSTTNAVTTLDSGLTTQLDNGTVVGQRLTLIGTSDTDVLRFVNGQGLNLNGDDWLSFDKKRLELEWDGNIWVECFRRS